MKEKIIQMLMQEASTQVLKGVSPQETSAVTTEFEHFLTMCLAKTYRTPSPKNDEDALWAGRYLIEEMCKVPPENRLEYLQRELLIEEISDLDADARQMAENSLKKSADLSALRAQARAIRDRIDELQHVLHAKGPDWEQSFERMLSEISLDCAFVLGKIPESSLRLGRLIRLMQDMGTWPPAWYAELWSQKNDSK